MRALTTTTTTTSMVVASAPVVHRDASNPNDAAGSSSNEEADRCLSELTENSLVISKRREVTRIEESSNNALALIGGNGGLYSNGLSGMTIATTIGGDGVRRSSTGSMAVAVAAPAAPGDLLVADPGMFPLGVPDSWRDWETRRRTEVSSAMARKNQYLRKMKRNPIYFKKNNHEPRAKVASLVSFHRRRLRLERSIGIHLQNSTPRSSLSSSIILAPEFVQRARSQSQSQSQSHANPNAGETTTPSALVRVSKPSTKKRGSQVRRRKVVRFREQEIAEATLEWRRESSRGMGRGKKPTTIDCQRRATVPFREAQEERKQAQRAVLDLQVGMKCMGL